MSVEKPPLYGDDANDLPPPPTYAEIYPGYNNALPPQNAVKLTYVDWVPRCLDPGTEVRPPVFDQFDKLIEFANAWLLQCPMYEVKSCETIERVLDKNFMAETESTLFHQSSHGNMHYVRSLRVWLQPKEDPTSPPDQIGMISVVPELTFVEVSVDFHYGRRSGFGITLKDQTLKIPKFDTKSEMLQKFNEKLSTDPIPGKIISIDTDNLKYLESHDFNRSKPDPNNPYWIECSAQKAIMYIWCLRVFYLVGQPHMETVGLQDFVPEIISAPKSVTDRPKYEKFGLTVNRAGQWIYSQPQLRILNLKTVDFQMDKGMFNSFGLMGASMGMGVSVAGNAAPSSGQGEGITMRNGQQYRVNTEDTTYTSGLLWETWVVKILRVAFAIPSAPEDPGIPVPRPLQVTTKVITPEQFGIKSYGTTTQTVNSVIEWLNAVGVPVLNAETHLVEVNPQATLIHTEDALHVKSKSGGRYWLTYIRLYLDGVFQDVVIPSTKPKRNPSSSCTVV